jgi:hypothetical protein
MRQNCNSRGHTFSHVATRGGGMPFKEGLKREVYDKSNFW